MQLGMKEFNKIVELSEEGLKIVEERQAHIEKERESIEDSKNSFKTSAL